MDWYLEEAGTIFYPMSARCQFEQDACETVCMDYDPNKAE